MLDGLKQWVPGWLIALVVLLLSAVVAGVVAWQAAGTWEAVVVAVCAAILGPGVIGAKALTSGTPTPPSDPTATAPVTP
jgi:membrane protein YdbS with pleckstrin-like domain